MKKKPKQNEEIKGYLYTEKVTTDEFSPLVNKGEFVLLDMEMKANLGDIVGVKHPEPPFYKLAIYDNNMIYFGVGAGVGRRLNVNINQPS